MSILARRDRGASGHGSPPIHSAFFDPKENKARASVCDRSVTSGMRMRDATLPISRSPPAPFRSS